MKTSITRILLGLSLLAVTACTKPDNYDLPEASLEGRLIDATTGQNFQTTTGSIRVRLEQLSWSDTPAPQEIPSKVDGTFKDTKLFDGRYRVTPIGGAFWPVFEGTEISITKGTSHDFELTPYLTLDNFTHQLDGKKLTLRFRINAPVTAGVPQILDVQPYVNTTMIVGAGAAIREYSEILKVNIGKQFSAMTSAERNIELIIPDLPSGRTFYVRVGARLDDSYKSVNYSNVIEVKVP